MGDYAKEFHNIRRLKFSHNGGSESRREGGGREGEKRRKGKEEEKRGETRRHASPSASWDRTSILVCFKPASGPLRAYARAYHTSPL